MSIKRNILLNPGPATTTDSVKYAQVVSDICPRENEFGQLMEKLSSDLASIVTSNPQGYSSVFFGGSGTCGIEAMISSIVPQNKTIVIVENGAYGARMAKIAHIYGIEHAVFQSSKYEQINFIKFESFLDAVGVSNISHIFMVHHETTSGLLNDIGQMGDICKKYNIDLGVDAVSSFAACPIDMDKMNLKFIVSTSNKNIQGMAGIAFVIGKQESFEGLKNIKPRNLYLDIYEQYKHLKEKKQLRFTPPVQTFYALDQAYKELAEEGVENRYARYCSLYEHLIVGLDNLELEVLVDVEARSKLVTTIVEPSSANYSFDKMHNYLYQYGITIYPGKVSDHNTFRIANIGQLETSDIDLFLKYLKDYLETI